MKHSPRNFIKAKSFYYLSTRNGDLVTARELCDATGGEIHSMGTLLSRWRNWKYVKWWIDGEGFFRRYKYSLMGKGRCYIKRMPDWYPFWNEAKAEVDTRIRERELVLKSVGFRSPDGRYHIFYAPFMPEDYKVLDSDGESDIFKYCGSLCRGPESALRTIKEIHGVNPSPELISTMRGLYV